MPWLSGSADHIRGCCFSARPAYRYVNPQTISEIQVSPVIVDILAFDDQFSRDSLTAVIALIVPVVRVDVDANFIFVIRLDAIMAQ